MDNITITGLKLNKGIDISGRDQGGDDVYLTSGSTINETVNIINQYCDGHYQTIIATFNVHPSFIKEDKKKYLNRLMKLVDKCDDLWFKGGIHNVEIDGHVFPNTFYLVLTYEKKEQK